jgi:hypothetical protein
MKKNAFIPLIILLFIGCKKYENDKFLSTYSPEMRLTSSSEENIYWTLVGHTDEAGQETVLPENMYNLRFETDGQVILHWAPYLNIDYTFRGEVFRDGSWSFNSNKDKLNLFGVDLEIIKLTVTKLELKTSSGAVYYFTKQPLTPINNMENVVNQIPIPLLGIVSDPSIYCKLVWSNSLNSASGVSFSAELSLNGDSVDCSISPYDALLGNAYITDEKGAVGTISFTRDFENNGYISMFIRGLKGGTGLYPEIFVNGMSVGYQFEEMVGGSWWSRVEFPVNVTGTVIIQIEGIGPGYGVNGIDEIRQWEKIN